MPRPKRFVTWAGFLLQIYPVYVALEWALMLPKWLYPYFLVWPNQPLSYFGLFLLYIIGYTLVNGILASEFVRKTQLEADQIAAREIQRTLQPENMQPLPGYEITSFYKPYRVVGGDYFDVVELPDSHALFALADVSGKGMPAALLAANIQALVRSTAGHPTDPVSLAVSINQHLVRYSPGNCFATAVFIVLSLDSGLLTYVNAGHNPPMLSFSGAVTTLDATGLPLGLLADSRYEAGTANLPPGGMVLVYTDGLIDSIPGKDAEMQLQRTLIDHPTNTVLHLQKLADENLSEDDMTVLVVSRGL